MEILFVAVVVVSAYTFTNILAQPEMIFGWYADLIDRLPNWIAKPLGKCDLCLSGQLALWGYVVAFYDTYSVVVHYLVVLFSIFFLHVFKKLMTL